MATLTQFVICLGIVFKLSLAIDTSKSPFDDVFEDVTSCSASCQQTYPLHTYPKMEDLRACQRGCRLFSMLEFGEVDYEETDFNATKLACKGACHDAYQYDGEDLIFACCLGCAEQLPFSIQMRKEYASQEPTLHLLHPLFSVHSIFQQLTSNIRGVSFSASMFFWQGDNNQVYVFETQPEIDIFTVDPDPQEPFNFGKPFSGFETNLEVLNDHDPTSDPSRPYSSHLDTSTWLDCVAKRSGLPRWLLSITILLSSVALLWLCCATMVTAPERRVHVPKLSIHGDLEYLKESKKSPIGSQPVYITTLTSTPPTSDSRVSSDDDDVPPLNLSIDIMPTQSKI
ncbi:transmembrane protein 59-like [Diadema antillarum]|uniref:transmembrane protein 59-like n=1 Tax=Diadema antillarum TaxID=105358 RepID=UPI003A8A0046